MTTYTISSGVTSSGITLMPTDQMFVLSGGRAVATTVDSSANQTIDFGGLANFTTIESGGLVMDAGTTFSAVVDSGGKEKITAGGVGSATVVNAGGFEYVLSGGIASASLVSGTEKISAGGTASAVTNDGTQYVFSGGQALSTINNGTQDIMAGTAGQTVNAGAQYIYSGGSAVGTRDTGAQYVYSGGAAISTTISSGGLQIVSGGIASGTEVNSGGVIDMYAGELVSALVNSVGTVNNHGGVSSDTSVSGLLSLDGTSGTAIDIRSEVFKGGNMYVGPEAIASATRVDGGEQFVDQGGLAVSAAVENGGLITVHGATSATGSASFGGVVSTTNVLHGGTLVVFGADGVTNAAADIVDTHLSEGGTIDLQTVQFSSSESATFTASTDQLTISGGATDVTLQLSGAYFHEYFHLTDDGTGGTDITVDGTPCYCRGTRIRTEAGEVAVEDLRIGDCLVTATGEARALRWIGRRSYAGRFAHGNRDVLPVLFRAGSLGGGLPRRDLYVSPLHAMFLDGVLIPAALLTNGHSIVQVQSVDQVDYFHLELDSHDVIVAEGALSESYVEDGNRGMFHNAREYAALYPDAAAAPAGLYCAPRLEDGELLEAIRRRLSGAPAAPAAQAKLTGWLDRVERGQIVGWAQDGAEPVHLRIVVDGATIGDVVADLPRPDVQAANGGALRCGFAYTIPGGLPPGGAHMIAVQRSADGAALPSSPRRLEMAPVAPRAEKAQPKLRGNLDRADRHQVAGWAQAGATPVALQILDNGIPVGRLLANRWRADVAEAGIGDGRHAFEFNFPTPLSATARHSIEVRRESDGAVLAGGPIAIEAADSFDPALEQAVAQAVAGLQGHDRARVLSFIIGQADRLKQQEADDAAGRTVRAAARRAGAAAGLRALVIDAEVPVADRDAGSQAILSHMRALQRLGYEVSFVAAEQMQRDGAALTAAGIAHCAAPFYASVEDVLRRQEGCFDVVYLHRLAMAEAYLGLVRRWLPKARAVYAVADLHHVRLARQADCEQRPELLAAANRARLAEFTAAWNADVVLTHSPAEAAVLRAAVPRATVRLVPWEVAPQPGAAGFAARGGIGFIGNYSHAPNADAARFLVQEIMPLVWAADPAITCALAGSAMPASLRGLARPGVHVLGHVDDIAGFFGGLRLTVAPLRFGAGIKGKVLDSLAAGVPCVVTPVAAEGLEMPADLVGADAPALAQAILRLHGDAAAHATARAAGLRLIERTNSAARVDNALATALGHRLPLAAGAIA